MASHRQKRILGVSLKMYLNHAETLTYTSQLRDQVASQAAAADIDLFVLPDYVSLDAVSQNLSQSEIWIGAQNCAREESGAYTGEVSARTIKELLQDTPVQVVAVGHAERRRYFNETDQDVAQKAALIVQQGMVPLICIGEKSQSSIASQAVGIAVTECKTQLEAALSGISSDADVLIAYEPVWAIGAAQPASADHVVAVVQSLRSLVSQRAGRTRILYGGAAGPGTFKALQSSVDGLFLARFGLEVKNVKQVIDEMSAQ